jgi:hypothetical protein
MVHGTILSRYSIVLKIVLIVCKGNPAYIVPFACSIHGSISISALQESLHMMVKKHAIFRTTFTVLDGTPYQTVAEYDRSTVPAMTIISTQRRVIQLEILKEMRKPFDLQKGKFYTVSSLIY